MTESVSAVIHGLIQRLNALQADQHADRQAVVKELVAVAYDRVAHLAHVILRQKFPRVGAAGADTVGVVSEVYQRMLKAFESDTVQAQLTSAKAFLGLARQHIWWELLDEAEKLDRRPADVPLAPGPSGSMSGPELSAASGINPVRKAQVRELRDAVEALPEPEREAITLVWLLGHTRSEAAVLLGKDEATIRRWLRKGEERLFEIFDGQPPF